MARPQKPIISRERAARAALSVIDIQGLNALNLEAVARKIGVKAPSLYYHFSDKAELLSEVALLLLKDIKFPVSKKMSWEESLTKLCIDTRRMILQHPNAAPLLLQFFPRHILLSAYDYWISRCPYPPELQMVISEGTEKLTFGSALFEAAARSNGVDTMPQFNPDQYPDLANAVRSNPHDNDELFEQTIKAFLAGFRVLSSKDTTSVGSSSQNKKRSKIAPAKAD